MRKKAAITNIASVVAVSKRPPTISGKSAFLFCGVFPVAWSPWKKKKNADEEDKTKSKLNSSNNFALRLVDKKDKQLREDIVKADELFETGNTSYYKEAYNILILHLV